MIFKNNNYRNWSYFNKDAFLLYNTNIGDRAVYSMCDSIQEGIVTMINEKGINIRTGCGNIFVKWYHVLEIHKPSKGEEIGNV